MPRERSKLRVVKSTQFTLRTLVCQSDSRISCQVSFDIFYIFNLLVGLAFLSHKTKETYVRLFQDLRKALIDEFGDIGKDKTLMFDCEPGAFNAAEEVLPEWHIRTCYFHFVGNVKKQAKKKVAKSARQTPQFKRWLDEILGKLFQLRFFK